MVNIYYNLAGDAIYEVKVYCSQDGGINWGNPLKHVSGDVGKDQIAGQKKKIIWNVLSDRSSLDGDIVFKVEVLNQNFNGEAGTFTDFRDGKNYKWVKIGNQIWMAENLNYSKVSWSQCYDEEKSNCNTYGRLYYWKHAIKICPQGWHLPSDSEWMTLVTFLGGESVAGGKMKEAGTSHWNFPNAGATNSGGFNALPGGKMYGNISSDAMGGECHFWSSYKSDTKGSLEFWISSGDDDFKNEFRGEKDGFSVRCLKDD